MKQRIAIPTVLDLLGGMQGSDPPVLVTDGEDCWSLHPLEGDPALVMFGKDGADRLLVEQSMPTLLRVLARHLGWDGVGRPVMRTYLKRPGTSPEPQWCVVSEYNDGNNRARYWWLPDHISADLDHLEALAAAVVWFARIERLRPLGLDEPFRGPVWSPASLAAAEKAQDLPPLEVKP